MSCPPDNSRRWFTGKRSTTKSHNWLKRVCEMSRKRRKKTFLFKAGCVARTALQILILRLRKIKF
jgi:hypothetical protein